MDPKSDLASSETGRRRPANRRWLALGGLAAVLLAAVLCVAAVAGIGGLLWLRNVQPAAVAPTPAAPVLDNAPQQPAAALPDASESTLPPDAPAGAAVDGVNRIAFVDSAGRLGTVASDGSDSRMLTAAGAVYQFPAWAPDSSRIAAVGIDSSQGGVYVWADQAGAQRASLYTSGNQPPIYLYWSPDSRQVSFLANDRSSLGLWLAEADGASPARQIASGQPFYWDWSQSGDRLFIHSGGLGRDARLAFLDPGNDDQAGDNVANPGLFQAPGVSRDGRYLAFGQAAGNNFQVTIEDQDSGERTTVPHVGLAALGWSPTTQHLAWTSPRLDQLTSAGPLRLLDAATGETTTLVQDTVFAFFWSPNGRSIAYLTLGSGADNPGAARPAGLAALSMAEHAQRGRPSLRLSVVDVASGQQRLLSIFRPSAIFLSQFLPFFDQYALSHRLWSPASDALVLPIEESAGANGIYVVSVETGETTRVADGTMAFWSWR